MVQGEELEAGPKATTRRQRSGTARNAGNDSDFYGCRYKGSSLTFDPACCPPPTADLCFMRQRSPILLFMTPLKLRPAV